MKLTPKKAYEYLVKSLYTNNGGWIQHSYYVGVAAGLIAERIEGLDAEQARVYGFLHDIGRSFGEMKIDHIFKGYHFLCKEGCPDVARICLTHSFPVKEIRSVTSIWDCSPEDYAFMQDYLVKAKYTVYDKLIQFCDNIASAEGIVILEKRMVDIVRRYGIDENNLMDRWEALFTIKKELEGLLGEPVEDVLGLTAVNPVVANSLFLEQNHDSEKSNTN